MMRPLDVLAAWVAIGLARTYQVLVSRRLPHVCIYHPSCSQYGCLAWQRHGFWRGSQATLARLRRCTGGAYAGEDWPPGVEPRPLPNRHEQDVLRMRRRLQDEVHQTR